MTGKVIDYCIKNHKCRTCDNIIDTGIKENHDCRLNHYGTAKAMESEGAVQLVTKSKLLENANAEVGVFIGDNDISCKHTLCTRSCRSPDS